jgi:hypothetical protein
MMLDARCTSARVPNPMASAIFTFRIAGGAVHTVHIDRLTDEVIGGAKPDGYVVLTISYRHAWPRAAARRRSSYFVAPFNF